MARPVSPVVFSSLRGMNSADPPTQLEPTAATDIHNVLLEPMALGRRRPSLETFSLSSGPSTAIHQLVRYQTNDPTLNPELWAFAGNSSAVCYRFVQAGGGWNSVSLSDTVAAFGGSRPHAAAFNNKLFLAYNSDVNRLHVWDGTTCRRVGIEASAAATVANTGAGAYAATLRYYKIQFRIYSGSNRIATSELSAAVSFTPSGGGTDARITKPTTPDSATHWVVYGSADGVTYYGPVTNSTFTDGLIPVATTTFDDRTTVSAYSALEVAPSVGLNIPPPAAKYLLATDNRLFMAGCWETSASSTQTATRNSRVWFTDVLGARDNTGEDESIPQTADTRYWVDCGEGDGDFIVGLGGPLDGAVYVFKRRSIWRLSPTGNVFSPYRADVITRSLGATWQDGIATGEDGAGNACVYFMAYTGPKRITPGYGIEDIGQDIRLVTTTQYSSVSIAPVLLWDDARRTMWWIDNGAQTAYAFQPQFESRAVDGVRYGWTRHTLQCGGSTNNAACLYYATYDGVTTTAYANLLFPMIGGATSDTGYLAAMVGAARRDVSASGFTPSVTSAIYQPGGLLNRVGLGHAVLEWDYPGAATAISVSVASVIGGPLAVTGTVTDTTTISTYTTAVVQEKLESIQLSDVFGLQATVTWDTAVDGSERPRIHALTIPITAQEGA